MEVAFALVLKKAGGLKVFINYYPNFFVFTAVEFTVVYTILFIMCIKNANLIPTYLSSQGQALQ